MRFAALMLVLSAGPVWASLERILGRPIPRLRYSPAVKRNRLYVAVPVVMGAAWWFLVDALCDGHGYGYCEWYGLDYSAVLGWIVYVGLRVSEGVVWVVGRIARHFG